MARQMRARRRTNTVDRAAEDRAFSRKVLERDGRICRVEIWDGERWWQHGIKGNANNPLQAAHVYPRGQCGKWKFEPIVGVAACTDCHDRLDRRIIDDLAVRVPPARERAAFLFLTAPGRMKSPPPRRLPPERPGEAA